jgi:hypothetical protein
VAAGTATITVTTVDGGKTASCVVAVSVDPTPTSVDEVADYLAGASNAGTEDDPIPLPVDLNLANDWNNLLVGIQEMKKYVALDLSACTMSGGEFDHSAGGAAGKEYVVSLVLPDMATSIKGSDNPKPEDFVAIKSISGKNVLSIGNNAFYSYDNALTEVSFPKATTIGYKAFAYCYNLKTVSLPEAESIGDSAFHDCNTLETVSLPKAKSIGVDAFFHCDNLKTVSLPEAISISNNAFAYCINLETVSLPKAKSIGVDAFFYCDKLKTAYLPEAISIGNTAFDHCINLETVDLSAVTSIGGEAFLGCGALKTMRLAASAPTLGNNILAYTSNKTITVQVPRNATGYVDTWKNRFKVFTTNVTVDIVEYP